MRNDTLDEEQISPGGHCPRAMLSNESQRKLEWVLRSPTLAVVVAYVLRMILMWFSHESMARVTSIRSLRSVGSVCKSRGRLQELVI